MPIPTLVVSLMPSSHFTDQTIGFSVNFIDPNSQVAATFIRAGSESKIHGTQKSASKER
jgi:hypothetical protein